MQDNRKAAWLAAGGMLLIYESIRRFTGAKLRLQTKDNGLTRTIRTMMICKCNRSPKMRSKRFKTIEVVKKKKLKGQINQHLSNSSQK